MKRKLNALFVGTNQLENITGSAHVKAVKASSREQFEIAQATHVGRRGVARLTATLEVAALLVGFKNVSIPG